MIVEGPSSKPVGRKFPFLVLQNSCSEAVWHAILRGFEFICCQDGILVCLSILTLRNFGGKPVRWRKEALFCYFFPAGVLLMLLGEGWCGWFYTPVCSYKFHALAVYLHSTFTVPPIGDAFGIHSNLCDGAFFAEIINVLGPFFSYSRCDFSNLRCILAIMHLFFSILQVK